MKKRSNLTVMMRLIGLVKPLTGYMILAVLLGVVGFLFFWHYAEPPCIVKLSVKAQGQNLKLQGFLKSVSSLCVPHR